MQLGDGARHGEAYAQAADALRVRRARLVEHLEDAVDLTLAQARAGVGHRDAHAVLAIGHAHGDGAAAVGVLDRVGEQVGQHLGQARRVDVELDRLGARHEAQLDLLALPLRPQVGDRRLGPLVHLGPLADQPQLAIGHDGEIEQLVDHAREGARVAGR